MDRYIYIRNLFLENRNEKRSDWLKKYMRNQYDFYGIYAKERKLLLKDFFTKEKKNRDIDWDFLDTCYDDDYREFQYLVIEYLLFIKDMLVFEDIPHILGYIIKKPWWDTVDILHKIIGYIGTKDNRVDSLMLDWSEDENFWVRRVSIDHQIGRGIKTNSDLLEKVIVNNFGSDEFFINKAIGWSLRDYGKSNPDWVIDFLKKNKSKMDGLSFREASKYLDI